MAELLQPMWWKCHLFEPAFCEKSHRVALILAATSLSLRGQNLILSTNLVCLRLVGKEASFRSRESKEEPKGLIPGLDRTLQWLGWPLVSLKTRFR